MSIDFEPNDKMFQFMHKAIRQKKSKKTNPRQQNGAVEIPPGYFSKRIEEMLSLSVDWDRWATPHETRKRLVIPNGKNTALDYAVFYHLYNYLKNQEGIKDIVYTPNPSHAPNNKAHCDIECTNPINIDKIDDLAAKLAENARWIIQFNDPVQ